MEANKLEISLKIAAVQKIMKIAPDRVIPFCLFLP
jgi:hypothetical protein